MQRSCKLGSLLDFAFLVVLRKALSIRHYDPQPERALISRGRRERGAMRNTSERRIETGSLKNPSGYRGPSLPADMGRKEILHDLLASGGAACRAAKIEADGDERERPDLSLSVEG
jgi:hypothetical protein